MIRAPLPHDEADRLDVIRELNLLDGKRDPMLETLVLVLARSFRVPICLITVVDRTRQCFYANHGLPVSETSRDCSFCAHMLWAPSPLIVLDSLADERFVGNPLVDGPPGIRFYAGVPVRARNTCVATLCLIDSRPRPAFTREEIRVLEGAARVIEERWQAQA